MSRHYGTVISLRMASGVTCAISTTIALKLLTQAHARFGPTLGEEAFVAYPQLAWFRDCVSARSSSGHVHEALLLLLRPPPVAPAEVAEVEVAPFD